MINDSKAEERLIPKGRPRPIDDLIAENLVSPAPSEKRRLFHLRVKAKGTVSDLVVEQRR